MRAENPPSHGRAEAGRGRQLAPLACLEHQPQLAQQTLARRVVLKRLDERPHLGGVGRIRVRLTERRGNRGQREHEDEA